MLSNKDLKAGKYYIWTKAYTNSEWDFPDLFLFKLDFSTLELLVERQAKAALMYACDTDLNACVFTIATSAIKILNDTDPLTVNMSDNCTVGVTYIEDSMYKNLSVIESIVDHEVFIDYNSIRFISTGTHTDESFKSEYISIEYLKTIVEIFKKVTTLNELQTMMSMLESTDSDNHELLKQLLDAKNESKNICN